MASRPRKRRVRLTARDTRIFEELLARKADTLGALHERHFPDALRDSARHRLSQLVAWGYLERHQIYGLPDVLVHDTDHGTEWVPVYTLTAKGLAGLRRRSLAASTLTGRSVSTQLASAVIPHQLAVNRVGELLGAQLTPEHLLDLPGQRRHRPDATYHAAPDTAGNTTVMLEVDLGHYSRQRILGKLATFLASPEAKAVLFACPTPTRAAWIAQTLRAAHGDQIMDRVQVLTFQQIHEGRLLRAEMHPDTTVRPEPGDALADIPHTA